MLNNYTTISPSLHLIQTTLGDKATVKAQAAEVPVNHLAVIDCSGSMYCDLPKIREQLKAKLPKQLKETDTISLIWFSGRGEFGALLEAEPVATLKDLAEVNKAIDRWLRPVGLTGFKEPLQEVGRLVDRVAKKNPAIFSLFFMSDGCDNQWPRAEILKAVEGAGQKVASATFVEYGYYADRPLLTAMAEKCGGNLIFAEDFDRYAPNFEAVLQRKLTGAPKVEVSISGDPIGGFAFGLIDGDLVAFAVEGNKVAVPEDLKEIWYLSPQSVGTEGKDTPKAACYAALSLFAQRMKSDVVMSLLKATGDVQFIENFASCFGKQKYSEFVEATKQAAFDETKRLVKGYDPNKVPADDAFTVLDLLRVLSSDEDNRVLVDSKDFKYSRIGRGQIDASEILTPEEQAEVTRLTESMGKTKDAKKIKELTEKIAAITASKNPALKFEADENKDGYSISSLTYNEERPNISFLIRKSGVVDISSRLPASEAFAKVPAKFKTNIFRNYAVIKDGLVNIDRLPVRLTAGTLRDLRDQGMPFEILQNPEGETLEQTQERVKKAGDGRSVNVVFNLKALPIINRKMVKAVSAKTLFETEFALTQARAAQKVYKAIQKEHFPKVSKGFVEEYGQEAAEWLKEQGFTDIGFSPKTVQAEAVDFYMGKELKVSLKGLSSLPSLKDVRTKMASGKLTASAALMAPYINEVDKFLSSEACLNSPNKEGLFEAWIEGQTKASVRKARTLISQLAQIKFSIVVGQVWPVEFKSLDENTLTVTVDGQKIEGKLDMREVEIKI